MKLENQLVTLDHVQKQQDYLTEHTLHLSQLIGKMKCEPFLVRFSDCEKRWIEDKFEEIEVKIDRVIKLIHLTHRSTDEHLGDIKSFLRNKKGTNKKTNDRNNRKKSVK